MNKSNFLDRFKKKWGIERTIDIVLILIVFSLAGMSVLKVNGYIMSFIGLSETTPVIIKSIVYILIMFPTYQLLLLFFGFCLGQFGFFWEKEKKLGKWITNFWSKKSSSK